MKTRSTERLSVIVFLSGENYSWRAPDWIGRGLRDSHDLVVRESWEEEIGGEGVVLARWTCCEIVAASEKIAQELKKVFTTRRGAQIEDCPTIPSSQWGGYGLKINTSARRFYRRLKKVCHCEVIVLTPTRIE